MKIRIIKMPPGEAPENIRQAWIGVEIPVPKRFKGHRTAYGVGVLSGPKSVIGQIFAVLLGRATKSDNYTVESKVAIDMLSEKSPEAANWWRQNTPHLIKEGKYFGFAAETCEELHDKSS